ncbi:DUF3410 domain-containing protein [Candidatus Gillettellia adelgis]
MKILFDENMPYAEKLFGRLGDVQAVRGRAISKNALIDAAALMVRSVTQVNSEVLANSCIDFVGTATAGTDHIDQSWLQQKGIGFSSAPGCNAIAVVEYVLSALFVLGERDGFQLRDKTIGIVGVGNIGACLHARLKALGVNTLLCDPPRAARGDIGEFFPLEKLVTEADVLTLHTPLNQSGPYASWHLINADLIAAIPDNRILINTCRGAVVDNAALLQALEKGKQLRIILDVWESEPNLSLPLLEHVDIGTAHIAGHTLEGKARGTTQIFEAYSRYLGRPQQVTLTSLLPKAKLNFIQLRSELNESKLKELIHLVYDVRHDNSMLRTFAGITGEFDRLRKYHQERREWSSLYIQCNDSTSIELLIALGFNVL